MTTSLPPSSERSQWTIFARIPAKFAHTMLFYWVGSGYSRVLSWLAMQLAAELACEACPRRLLRSSRTQEIFQPPQQGFFSVHAQLQLLGKIVRLLWNYIVKWLVTKLVVRLENRYFQSCSWELCTAVNLFGIKIYVLCLMFSLFGISLDPYIYRSQWNCDVDTWSFPVPEF